MNSKNRPQKIPYGVSNFRKLIESNSLYVDKTRFIEVLEEKYEYISFLRPRRFGKSLFISTLSYYYDEYYADIYDDLFKDTYIGKNPTAQKSSYKILFLEFSGITTTNPEIIERDFANKVRTLLRNYLNKYNYPSKDINYITSLTNSEALISEFFGIVSNDKVYVLIDEYDMFQTQISLKGDTRNQHRCHFANSLLGESIDDFKKILGKGGFVRSFYETIKTATQMGVAQRVFISGVTPITMDTMTSGFNIVKNLNNIYSFHL